MQNEAWGSKGRGGTVERRGPEGEAVVAEGTDPVKTGEKRGALVERARGLEWAGG